MQPPKADTSPATEKITVEDIEAGVVTRIVEVLARNLETNRMVLSDEDFGKYLSGISFEYLVLELLQTNDQLIEMAGKYDDGTKTKTEFNRLNISQNRILTNFSLNGILPGYKIGSGVVYLPDAITSRTIKGERNNETCVIEIKNVDEEHLLNEETLFVYRFGKTRRRLILISRSMSNGNGITTITFESKNKRIKRGNEMIPLETISVSGITHNSIQSIINKVMDSVPEGSQKTIRDLYDENQRDVREARSSFALKLLGINTFWDRYNKFKVRHPYDNDTEFLNSALADAIAGWELSLPRTYNTNNRLTQESRLFHSPEEVELEKMEEEQIPVNVNTMISRLSHDELAVVQKFYLSLGIPEEQMHEINKEISNREMVLRRDQ